MKTDEKKEQSKELKFKQGVRAMLTRRRIKNFVPMYSWMRNQKQLAVDASYLRIENVTQEMLWLEEMVVEDETLASAKMPEWHDKVEVIPITREDLRSIKDE